MTNPIRILLADDHPPLRIGLRVILDLEPDISVVAEANDGSEALAQVQRLLPDVALLDVLLPKQSGLEMAAAIRAQKLHTRILALSAYDDACYVRSMLAAGAEGYVLKDEPAARIVAAVRAVAVGKRWFSPAVTASIVQSSDPQMDTLTEREAEVLTQMAAGKTNAQIAEALNITDRTVRFHVENLLSKLHADNRTEAVVEAIRRGWLVL